MEPVAAMSRQKNTPRRIVTGGVKVAMGADLTETYYYLATG
jgi:hypothetical protein